MSRSGSALIICAASIAQPQLTAAYLLYCADTLLEHGLTPHAFLPLSLLRVLATELLAQPAMERVVLLQTTHLLAQLGMAAAAPSPIRPRKVASLRDKQLWLRLAAMLADEGQWAAAQAWRGVALPLLQARGERADAARCQQQLARVGLLVGDCRAALRRQLLALEAPLELPQWAAAILQLAECQRACGDERGQAETLSRALDVCREALAQQPLSAPPDALAALAAVQCALAEACAAEARAARAAGLPAAEAEGRAAALKSA